MFKTKKMVTVVAMVAMLALTGKESASAKIQLSPVDEVIEMVGSSNVSTVSASLSISEEEKAILGKTGEYSYNSSDCKKITGLGYAGASSTSVKRVDAALSADEKVLGVWCKISSDRAQISLYDMDVIKKYFYEKGNSTYAMRCSF